MRLALLLLAAVGLLSGIAGGLARLGVIAPLPAAAFHGVLMVSGFLGTVISLERAVALGKAYAYLAPLAAGLGTLALIAGLYAPAAWLWIAAPIVLLAASVHIARRQPALHTAMLAVAAAAWLGASILQAIGLAAPAAGFSFLILTIAAERLEMTRLTKRPSHAAPIFIALAGTMLLGAAISPFEARWGAVVFGASLVALSAWLAIFDIARRTVRTEGLARYAAVALLAGYAWLAIGGAAWALRPGPSDPALHALGLGFVFSMILAHAPIVVPAVARIRVPFVALFYGPLGLLHVSVFVRVVLGAADAATRALGGVLNAAAIVLFIATLLYVIITRNRGTDFPRA